ncbi:MAG: hypothetical protein RLZZ324_680 [Candidatus Parcubacteria bacterium]|jgi:hypothetical protein
MPKIIVVTNPAHDEVTTYFGIWMEKALLVAHGQADTRVITLNGASANRTELERVVAEHKPGLVLFNGHGNASAMGGFANAVLVAAHDNENVLSGTITHMLACDAGLTLGPRVVQLGGRAFLGYAKPYLLVHDELCDTAERRESDPVATLVLGPAFGAVTALIRGATARQAFMESQERHKETLRMLISHGNQKLLAEVGGAVFHNMKCQVLLGAEDAAF